MSQLDDFIKEFLVESREGLDRLDSDLVALEENPHDHARCDSAFRSLHTIKGNSGFLDFHRLGELAHVGENVLQLLRSGELQLDNVVIDALLELIDVLRQMLNHIASTKSEGSERYGNTEAKLRAIAQGSRGSAPAATSPTPGAGRSAPNVLPPAGAAGSVGMPTNVFQRGSLSDTDEGAGIAVDFKVSIAAEDANATVARPRQANPKAVEEAAIAAAKQKAPKQKPAAAKASAKKASPSKPAAKPSEKEAIDPDETKYPAEDAAANPAFRATSSKDDGSAASTTGVSGVSGASVLESEGSSLVGRPPSHPGSGTSGMVRVDVQLLDRLMNLVGELVLARNQIVERFSNVVEPSLVNPIQQLNSLTSDLQDGVLKTRMQPIGSIWQRYPRMVRDFARTSGKEVALHMTGQETELDKSLVEAITDPLVHLIRNAIDHGIEKSYLRKIKGKPKQGVISLKASHESGQVHIEITDDGAGLDLDKIRKKAVQRGLLTPEQAAALADASLRDSIFAPGFSTAEEITSLSGRGVGLDVVKTNIERIGGTIEIDSERDVGTTFRLTVPLTLAIIPALIVTSGGQRFAIPQTNVVEMLSLRRDAALCIEKFHDAPVMRLRGEVLPVVFLAEQLKSTCDQSAAHLVMVLKTGTRTFALVVDEIGNSEEIVVKPLGSILEGMPEFSGATIMGDGSVALILDVRGIAKSARLFATDRSLMQAAAMASMEEPEVITNTSLLVAEVGPRQRISMALDGVVRIEVVPRDRVEISTGREVVQYRGEILPLVFADRVLNGKPQTETSSTTHSDRMCVVVYSCLGNLVGIVVQKVIDSVDSSERLVPARVQGVIVGTSVVLGCVTDFIDVMKLVEVAGVEFLAAAESN